MEKNRDRSKNFKESEIRLLLDIVKSHKDVLECKKTDHVSNRDKDILWVRIQTEFNEASGVYFRDAKALKNKYENLKKTTKRKFAEEKSYTMGTGGGPPIKVEITDTDLKIKELLGDLVVFGGNSQFDSDANSLAPVPVSEIENLPVVLEEELYVNANSMEQHQCSTSDVTNKKVFGGLVGIGLPKPALPSVHDNEEFDVFEHQNRSTSSGNFSILRTPEKKDEETDKPTERFRSDIKSFNMRDLRKTTSTPLAIQRKKKSVLDASVAGKKVEAVSNAKKEVLELQKNLYSKQIQLLEEEHNAKMRYLEEEHMRRIKLLDMKIEKQATELALLKKD